MPSHVFLAFSFALYSEQVWTTKAQAASRVTQAGKRAQGRSNPGLWGAQRQRPQLSLVTQAELQQSGPLPHPWNSVRAKPCLEQCLKLRKKRLQVLILDAKKSLDIVHSRVQASNSLPMQERKPRFQRWKLHTQRKPKARSRNSPGEARAVPVSPVDALSSSRIGNLPHNFSCRYLHTRYNTRQLLSQRGPVKTHTSRFSHSKRLLVKP